VVDTNVSSLSNAAAQVTETMASATQSSGLRWVVADEI
jgi:hypothetical protein